MEAYRVMLHICYIMLAAMLYQNQEYIVLQEKYLWGKWKIAFLKNLCKVKSFSGRVEDSCKLGLPHKKNKFG